VTRRIAVVTGTRAEYGLLRGVLDEIRSNPDLELALIVTGSHLAAEFGGTRAEIDADGVPVAETVPILEGADDSPLAIARAAGRATSGIAEALDRVNPDLVVLLGDRYEILAAGLAAVLLRLPIAHIAGGEVTEGAVDDSLRHALTKLAHLHFVAAGDYRDRVIQLGEDPARVFDVGSTGLDAFERVELLDRAALGASLGVDLGEGRLALATFHPETLADEDPADWLRPSLTALDAFPDLRVVITKANADAGGQRINEVLEGFVAERSDRITLVASLGQVRYLSFLGVADVVIGNSSSGIIEAPVAGTPTVNIGDRQRGRLRAPAIVDVLNEAAAIEAGIARALSPELQDLARQRQSPYGAPGAARRIVDILATVDLSSLRTKAFFTPPTPEPAVETRTP
jgi:UDP-N-acetylglucosamine 2-epimerase (non-hydrolysing)